MELHLKCTPNKELIQVVVAHDMIEWKPIYIWDFNGVDTWEETAQLGDWCLM